MFRQLLSLLSSMVKNSQLLSKLEEINAILQVDYKDIDNIGVLTGSTGIALFHFYYSKFKQQEINASIGSDIISSVVQKINKGYHMPTFCTGIAGAAWAIELLREEDFIELDSDALLGNLDDFLESSLQVDKRYNFYDFLHGNIGIGLYFLKRYENTASTELKSNYKRYLLKIISKLQETALIKGNTAKWESNLIFSEKLRGYNLSLSHGISSITNFLARLAEHSDFKDATITLLQQATNYILQQHYDSVTSTSCFPDWITTTNEKSKNARLAWCYGDLGIGISLWRAGKILSDQELCKKALTVLKHSTKRRDIEEARIMDAGLCHGSYGVAHIFNYMYKETQEPVFKETAIYWLQQALDMAIHKDGYAGYYQWRGGDNPGWRKEVNLLEGISGIGLAIISHLASFETKWDECLMIG